MTNSFDEMINSLIFVGNNTCHASRKNSATWQVFAFYKVINVYNNK